MDLTNVDCGSSSFLFREYLRETDGAKVFSRRFRYRLGKSEYDCPASILADLVFAEYQLRYQAQLAYVMFEPTLGGTSGNGWSLNVLRGEVAVAGIVAVAPNGFFTSRGEV
ncbi:uncharacterized protein N7506_008873 [Penicillium brevicompactum]|uniref:uncharacterized protein n=1 Tax=Penicillium brevicompactum TaxID=5074 RepID=UPI002540DDEF|nr:uncharacterized protein N7506_008873 [Penicillium brevicompactum]KAJ5325771.1 hypothetical protein N7506_008873 [Penicillium brevicompactum]